MVVGAFLRFGWMGGIFCYSFVIPHSIGGVDPTSRTKRIVFPTSEGLFVYAACRSASYASMISMPNASPTISVEMMRSGMVSTAPR